MYYSTPYSKGGKPLRIYHAESTGRYWVELGGILVNKEGRHCRGWDDSQVELLTIEAALDFCRRLGSPPNHEARKAAQRACGWDV